MKLKCKQVIVFSPVGCETVDNPWQTLTDNSEKKHFALGVVRWFDPWEKAWLVDVEQGTADWVMLDPEKVTRNTVKVIGTL